MKNRDMFYQNINQGYNNPGMFVPPSGYNMNSQFQAYGPNMMYNNPNMTGEQMGYYDESNEKTLELEEIMPIFDKVIESVIKKHNAVLRDK